MSKRMAITLWLIRIGMLSALALGPWWVRLIAAVLIASSWNDGVGK